MKNIKFILAIFTMLLLITASAQAGKEPYEELKASKKIEYGGPDLTFRVDKDVDKMIDKDVVNDKGESIGTVENVLISDPENIQYAIISVGGFFGIGDKLVAVPVKHLQLNKDKGNITLKNVTGEELKKAPEFTYEKTEGGGERFPQYGPKQQ